MGYDVISIGSATIDNFADTDSELIKIEGRQTKEEFIAYPLGTKVLIKNLNVTVGGGGTNTAVAFSRLGLNTGFLGKVGDDENGRLIVENLKEQGIGYVGAVGGQTGFSVILDSIKDDRTILTYKGCNSSLYYNEIGEVDAGWLYITSMIGDSFATIEKIVQETSAKVVFNPSNYQAELGYKNLRGILSGVDILILNLEEAGKLMGKPSRAKLEVPAVMKELAELEPSMFLITDGGNGVHVYDKETGQLTKGYPSPNVKVVETTGAGDSLGSGFTAGLIKGYDIEKSLKLGMLNAESVIRSKGAKENLLTEKKANTLLEKDNRRIEVTTI